ncbi:alkaline phosphatase D family protein [Actinomadura miaoliensis]|uniref:Alkaline phosphatase D family protein n=1 Tax=Actinomadura miaoliensis TaxID=430685 RepID=A0ABP7WY14_9ACTN
MLSITRRRFLAHGAAAGVLVMPMAPSPRRRTPADPFTLGVASGDPLPDSVILWTRLAPRPLDVGGGMPDRPIRVEWQVAEDEHFHRVVRSGETLARPESAHSVHVEPRGLRPASWYFYRFRVGRDISPVGRTRTAPAPGSLSSFAFAVASCQDWQNGYFAAYQHIAREDLELLLHLGDYIYEEPITPTGTPDTPGFARASLPPEHLRPEAMTLDQYRLRYALYKSDPQLQAAHAALPWVLTWDDHEVDGNWAGETPADPDQQPPAAFRARLAAATRAYYEHLPLRAVQPLYRRLTFGDMVEFNVTDTRRYRVPGRTMLGDQQESWLLQGLSRSRARWNVVTAQVVMAQLDLKPGPGRSLDQDKWDGFPESRRRILERAAHVRNPVVLSGDSHVNIVSDLTLDFDDPAARTVATEFTGTAIASRGTTLAEQAVIHATMGQEMPYIRYFEGYHRGYLTCRLTPSTWTTEHRAVDTAGERGQVVSPDAAVRTNAAFVVEDGRPGAHRS